jgi:hypothetical protein
MINTIAGVLLVLVIALCLVLFPLIVWLIWW